jgi:hypothetical protein
MSNQLRLDGLTELRQALRQLPAELAAEAGVLVAATGERAAAAIVAGYHTGPTGNLKARVGVTVERSAYGVNAIVKSRAPHAWIYESGTDARQTGKGWNRGRSPRFHTFVDTVQPARRAMEAGLIAIVQRTGLVVTRT